MHTLRLGAAALVAALLPSCYQFQVTGEGGYAQLGLDGDFGFVDGTSTASIQQDVESAFGLGDDQGSPYARVALDLGVPHLSASGFIFEDDGTGTLTANFGENLTAGTAVDSEFDLAAAKIALAFDIDVGPVTVSPGVAVEYVDLQMSVRDRIGIATEEVDLQAPIPLAFVRAQVELGPVTLLGEGGYLQVDVEDVDASLLDLEFMARVHPTEWLHVFGGYRLLRLEGDGEVDGDSVDLDLDLAGWVVGGGIRF